ncbi:MAG: helix-turn-helix transcriptional regulator, partial [Clostridiales bacterium]|nr:helix-turn-helix transcriptional regulator [Clostridiales bacterium]
METFSDRLKAARERKGMMQRDVADVLGCAPTSLTNWEHGKVQPSLEVLARLCEVLGISPLDLLDRHYTYNDIVAISLKPAYERTYQESVALNFSYEILQ